MLKHGLLTTGTVDPLHLTDMQNSIRECVRTIVPMWPINVMAFQMLGGTMVRNGVLCSLALFIFPMINQQSLPAETDGIWLIVILGKDSDPLP